ncbi:hypothetical protein [Stenotrophomonas sp. SY1]|jgi:uncharacterized membrane protein YebE (DUF533 family)|uniref:hypothetical protein n=1 Tax=Stenotrophomonas sp. SY1 TaxID=477235 RepID=UPI001E5CBD3A|nr:hypothetical protein [Stenotrophomonas sp. SY1]MCD9085411.1 hypothetical protein [Stenotrophomonas sp. SY1]
MSKFSDITGPALERALELVNHAGGSIKGGGANAAEWLKAGAAIGAMKTGGRAVTRVAKRNPTATIAVAAVGLGLLGYALYRKNKRDNEAVEAKSRQIAQRRRHAASVTDETSDIGSDA